MIPTRLLLLAAAVAFTAGTVGAQGITHMTLNPESKVTLVGSSNVHDWECASNQFQAQVTVDSTLLTLPLLQVARPITTVSVTIPVRSLKCGHGKMDDNMYKALKADQFPQIQYTLATYDVNRSASTANSFTATTTGDLTVSGKTIHVQIPITATRNAAGAITGEGKVALKMTDFGINPPSALLGTLRTKNDIEIAFKVQLDKSVVVALLENQ
jgi:polyisoprenoid-binding protein YceI